MSCPALVARFLFRVASDTPARVCAFPLSSASAKSTGGSVLIKSGPSEDSSSGDVTILTDDSAGLGVSGSVSIGTGLASRGPSGDLALSTGAARTSGNIQLEVGDSTEGRGGNITAIAGDTSHRHCKSSKSASSPLLVDASAVTTHLRLFLGLGKCSVGGFRDPPRRSRKAHQHS